MFSNVGRSTTSKYRILKEKDAILQKRFKFKKPERTKYNVTTLPVEEINEIALKEQISMKKVNYILGKSGKASGP